MWVQEGKADFLDAVFSVRVQYFSQNGFLEKRGLYGRVMCTQLWSSGLQSWCPRLADSQAGWQQDSGPIQ